MLETKSKDEAIARFHQVARQSRFTSGHSYSGEIGMKSDLIEAPEEGFASERAAREWVQDHNEKWGPAHLVRLKDGRYGYGGWCSS